jgi:hypothetical protein
MTDVIKPTKTEEVIADLLCERTMRCLVDSSMLGRQDERNNAMVAATQLPPAEAFKLMPPATLTFRWGDPEITVNIFHFLTENLTYDEGLAEFFDAFEYLCWVKADGINSWAKEEAGYFPKVMRCARAVGIRTVRWLNQQVRENHQDMDMWNRGCPWYDCLTVQAFYQYLLSLGYEVGGIYGEGDPVAWYTYNEENVLSQDFQCWYFSAGLPPSGSEGYDHVCRKCDHQWWSDDDYKVECPECESCLVYSTEVDLPVNIDGTFAVITIHNGADARWGFTRPVIFECNDSCNELGIMDYGRASIGCSNCEARWFLSGGYWEKDEQDYNIDEYELVKLEHAVTEPAPIADKKIFVDEDGNGYCPVCGHRLKGSMY